MIGTLRRLTFDDIPEIARVGRECPMENWDADDYAEQFEVEGTSGFGIEDAGHLVAALVYTPDARDALYVVQLGVVPGHRRRGLATRLLTEVIRLGKPVTLHVRAGNSRARALYRGLGFVDVRTEPKFYRNNGEDAILMLRT